MVDILDAAFVVSTNGVDKIYYFGAFGMLCCGIAVYIALLHTYCFLEVVCIIVFLPCPMFEIMIGYQRYNIVGEDGLDGLLYCCCC